VATDETAKAECRSPACPWAEEMIDLSGKIVLLEQSHQMLASLTKRAYQHSQQTFRTVKSLEAKVDGLLAEAARGSTWRQEMQELQGVMAEMLSKVAAAVDKSAQEG
jgi:hypothetical protein